MSAVIKKIIKYYLPAIVWGILIFSFSNGSVPTVSEVYWQDFVAHKMGHIFEYAILGILIYRALLQEKLTKEKIFICVLVITFLYGLTDEFHQSFTPTREPRFRDVIIDTIGGSLGVLVIWKLLPKMHPRLVSLAKKLELV